jgi:hypothetical protein
MDCEDSVTHDYTLERRDAYALGTLSRAERNHLDEHLAVCASCSRAIGEAERVVCEMIEMTTPLVNAPATLESRIKRIAEPQRSKLALWRARSSAMWGALAAAVILTLGLTTMHFRQETLRSDAVLATIATSHFKHVSLTPRAIGAPPAKVLYAPDRSWIYLIVDAAPCECHLIAVYGDRVRDFGAPEENDLTSTLFIKDAGKPTSVRLVGNSGVLADGDLK